jgi:RimJ/RimL family protein N-acetyltransferase
MGGAVGDITFRAIRPDDRERLLQIAARVWEGHDYLPRVFDRWVDQPGAYFGGMELGGRLVGCGRVLSFDGRRGWLEALRVDPDLQQRGLGREMSRHVIRVALALGLRELMFSTYFGNRASIAISERFGFRRLATFTHLDREVRTGPVPPPAGGVTITAGMRLREGIACNDWFFVPADVPGREDHFPGAREVSGSGATLLLCDNVKNPDWLEIAHLSAPGGAVPGACLDVVLAAAHAEGRVGVHLMLPEGMALDPFVARGFAFEEQPRDVYLYAGRAEELRV